VSVVVSTLLELGVGILHRGLDGVMVGAGQGDVGVGRHVGSRRALGAFQESSHLGQRAHRQFHMLAGVRASEEMLGDLLVRRASKASAAR